MLWEVLLVSCILLRMVEKYGVYRLEPEATGSMIEVGEGEVLLSKRELLRL